MVREYILEEHRWARTVQHLRCLTIDAGSSIYREQHIHGVTTMLYIVALVELSNVNERGRRIETLGFPAQTEQRY